MSLGAPQNVLTRNAGNGVLEVAWQEAAGTVDYYDIYVSSATGGPFVKGNEAPVSGLIGRVFDLPFDEKIYTKVRAIGVDGEEGPYSDLGLDAVAGRAVCSLRFSGPIGDQIPVGSMFAAILGDELIAVEALESGTITG